MPIPKIEGAAGRRPRAPRPPPQRAFTLLGMAGRIRGPAFQAGHHLEAAAMRRLLGFQAVRTPVHDCFFLPKPPVTRRPSSTLLVALRAPHTWHGATAFQGCDLPPDRPVSPLESCDLSAQRLLLSCLN